MQNPLSVIDFVLSGFFDLFRGYTVWLTILLLPFVFWFFDTLLSMFIRNTKKSRYIGLFGRFSGKSYNHDDMRYCRKETSLLQKKRSVITNHQSKSYVLSNADKRDRALSISRDNSYARKHGIDITVE